MRERSIKRLRSAVHSTAHHAESGLSYIHPHLGKLCASINRDEIGLNLLTGTLVPPPFRIPREVKLSTQALCKRFEGILRSEHLDSTWLSEAAAEFLFRGTTWPYGCIVKVKTVDGREVEAAVRNGRKGKIIRASV
jgi:hypothetical protein